MLPYREAGLSRRAMTNKREVNLANQPAPGSLVWRHGQKATSPRSGRDHHRPGARLRHRPGVAPEISTLHCLLYRTAEGYRVRDCGSRTGTRVNGDVPRPGVLAAGDVLQIGPFSFTVTIPPAPDPIRGNWTPALGALPAFAAEPGSTGLHMRSRLRKPTRGIHEHERTMDRRTGGNSICSKNSGRHWVSPRPLCASSVRAGPHDERPARAPGGDQKTARRRRPGPGPGKRRIAPPARRL